MRCAAQVVPETRESARRSGSQYSARTVTFCENLAESTCPRVVNEVLHFFSDSYRSSRLWVRPRVLLSNLGFSARAGPARLPMPRLKGGRAWLTLCIETSVRAALPSPPHRHPMRVHRPFETAAASRRVATSAPSCSIGRRRSPSSLACSPASASLATHIWPRFRTGCHRSFRKVRFGPGISWPG